MKTDYPGRTSCGCPYINRSDPADHYPECHYRLNAETKPAEQPVAGWRGHSVQFAKGEKCPETIETLQAAWDRDQELIEDQRKEIASLKQTVNQLRQKPVAGRMVPVELRLLMERLMVHFFNLADFDPTYPPNERPMNEAAYLYRELRALLAADTAQQQGEK